MAITGADVKLLKKTLEGKNNTVPVGKFVITNSIPEDEGENKVENITVDDFETTGPEEYILGREQKRDSVDFKEKSTEGVNISEIVFDVKKGSIILTKANQEVLEISGFMTQKDFGVGPRGSKGDRGDKGINGLNGDDGDDGEKGCEGLKGEQGNLGLAGADGEDGEIGEVGEIGDEGDIGEQGEQGETGIIGFEGARGLRGDPSNTSSDLVGESGTEPDGNALISSSTPTINNLWAKPV